MNGFLMAEARRFEALRWGQLAGLCGPGETDARDLNILEVRIDQGGGHSFHRHPNQEELIYVVEGRIEQWLEHSSKTLGPGDAVFIPRGMVHASFNDSAEPARVLAILGPCVGAGGYECDDVYEQAPWNALRKSKDA